MEPPGHQYIVVGKLVLVDPTLRVDTGDQHLLDALTVCSFDDLVYRLFTAIDVAVCIEHIYTGVSGPCRCCTAHPFTACSSFSLLMGLPSRSFIPASPYRAIR